MLLSGAETVTKAVNEGKAKLVHYAEDVSDNSLKGVIKAADVHHTPAIRIPYRKEELSFALGKHCGIVCTTDPGFAKKMIELTN
jgi:ribosomal protein L7Ae-like RNA K-turn-binding protein